MVTDRGPTWARLQRAGLVKRQRDSGWPPIKGIAWKRIEEAKVCPLLVGGTVAGVGYGLLR